jgi:hypothetical protein
MGVLYLYSEKNIICLVNLKIDANNKFISNPSKYRQ